MTGIRRNKVSDYFAAGRSGFQWRVVIVLILFLPALSFAQDRWDLTILHTNSINGALDNCG